jgi:protein arginine kinase
MGIDDLFARSGAWMSGTGPESDIVMTSRIRLARNIEGFPFQPRLSKESRSELERRLSGSIRKAKLEGDLEYFNLDETESIDRMLFVERHLISKEHAEGEGDRGVAFSPSEMVSIMTLEEDHLRIQVMRSGLLLDEAWGKIDEVDNRLEACLPYAFSSDYGYLTACPTNVGTGMRVSVMLHLPALVMTKQIEKVFQAVSKINMVVRGLYGEGTQASGDFYQISNQVTLGTGEEDLLREFESVVPKIIDFERRTRHRLVEDSRKNFEDRVWRDFGILKTARTISSEETMDRLSTVRMGVNVGVIDSLEIAAVNELFILSQPAHLQKLEGRILEPDERDVARATFIRKKLDGLG